MEEITLEAFAKQLINGSLDAEIDQLEEEAQEQTAYHHPLKPAVTAHYHELGKYNIEAVKKLRDLKAHLVAGKDIVDPRNV